MMNRLTEDQLIARLHRDLPRADLLAGDHRRHQRAAAGWSRAPLPPSRREAARRRRRLPGSPGVKDVGQPSEADLTKFYEGSPGPVPRSPNSRGLHGGEPSPPPMSRKPEDVQENKVREEYEQRKDEFETPEQRQVQADSGAPPRTRRKRPRRRSRRAKDWKAVATTIAKQDPETIDLGADEAAGNAAGAGRPSRSSCRSKKPSEPIKTAARPGTSCASSRSSRQRTQTFEQVKPQIEQELAQQAAIDRLEKARQQGRPTRPLPAARRSPITAGKFGPQGNDYPRRPMSAAPTPRRESRSRLPAAKDEILKTVFSTEQERHQPGPARGAGRHDFSRFASTRSSRRRSGRSRR